MELRNLRSFLAVADARGFRRASASAGVGQSVLSRRVRDLEDELGASLFERNREGVRLTFAGEQFLEETRRLLRSLDSAVIAVGAAGHASEGRLRIGVVASIASGFPRRLLRTWLAEHPGVALDIWEATPAEHVAAILGRNLDITFITGSDPQPGCEIEPLWQDRVMAAICGAHPYAASCELRLQELAGERFLLPVGGFGPEIRDYIIKHLSSLGVSPRIEFLDVGREVLLSTVGLGMGVTLVSSLEAGVSYPNVTFVPVGGTSLPFHAVWAQDNDNPALRRFLSLARIQARREACSGSISRKPDPSP